MKLKGSEIVRRIEEHNKMLFEHKDYYPESSKFLVEMFLSKQACDFAILSAESRHVLVEKDFTKIRMVP